MILAPREIEMAGLQDGASRFTVCIVWSCGYVGGLLLWEYSHSSGWGEYILPTVLAPANNVQVLSGYLASLIADDLNFEFNLFKSVGLFCATRRDYVFVLQGKLMNIYGGGTKG